MVSSLASALHCALGQETTLSVIFINGYLCISLRGEGGNPGMN